MEPKKYKPVILKNGVYLRNMENDLQQRLLLKALQVTQDPKKLKDMIGAKTVAEVHRTFDKMALRKQYHAALTKLGIDFEYLVTQYKDVLESNNSSYKDKLSATNALMKSLGVNDYKDAPATGGTWEQLLVEESQKALNEPLQEEVINNDDNEEYEVIVPAKPQSVIEKQKEENKLKSLYE